MPPTLRLIGWTYKLRLIGLNLTVRVFSVFSGFPLGKKSSSMPKSVSSSAVLIMISCASVRTAFHNNECGLLP